MSYKFYKILQIGLFYKSVNLCKLINYPLKRQVIIEYR